MDYVRDAAGIVTIGGSIRLTDVKHAGHRLALRRLVEGDMPYVLRLQDTINTELCAAGKAEYVVARSEDDFRAHMQDSGVMLGVFDADQLVAQSIMGMPQTAASDHGCDLTPDHVADTLMVMKGVLVHPDYRGNHLMRHMGDVGIGLARKWGRRSFVAEAAVGNHPSWRVMLEMGLRITTCDVAPSDGAALYLAQMDLREMREQEQAFAYYLNPRAPWWAQKAAFGEGAYVGARYHDGLLGLAPRR